jgi:hypothetical protein
VIDHRELTFLFLLTHLTGFPSPVSRVQSYVLLGHTTFAILRDSIHTSPRLGGNMVKTGIPFMLEDWSGSLSSSTFIDLYGRMSLILRCTRRDPDGASQYAIYNSDSTQRDMPVATLEYGAAGALGDITTIGPGGSPQTQPMAAFLVEVGGYATVLLSSYSLSLNTGTHTRPRLCG